jgi:predicted SAM-dependent methyltransferase
MLSDQNDATLQAWYRASDESAAAARAELRKKRDLRINFWCGRQVLDGWFNVDAVRNKKAPRPPELLHSVEFEYDGRVRKPLPLADGCAEELQAIHAIEHVAEWEAPHLMAEWLRLLKPGGLLVLELPNLECAARNLLAGLSDQMSMWPIYGDGSHRDPLMCHKFGYTPSTIARLVKAAGFIDVKILPPVTHGARHDRDMRVEARRP